MNSTNPSPRVERDQVQNRLQDNFARHLLGVTLYLQTEIMDSLTNGHGHANLRLGYEPYITLIGPDGNRLSSIADTLQITRQAANQAANQIEAAGYIQRLPDPEDGRAKILALTGQGRQLRKHGTGEMTRLQQQFQELVGNEALKRLIKTLFRLCSELELVIVRENGGGNAELGALLPRLRDYTNIRLMHLTIARGHPSLKQSFGQVLTAIGPQGGRIQQMAEHHGVSKQAISAIATELEELGYIRRVPDAQDARQLVLHFTPNGQQLMADSIASVDELYQEFASIIGKRPMQDLCKTLLALYSDLHLERDIFENSTPMDIRKLAQQLVGQLGSSGARALGHMLIKPGEI